VATNELLVEARLSQPSRSRPRQALSRKELAALVNQYIWDTYRQRTGLDENYVGKLERGVVRWPRDVYREALRAVLGTTDDSCLGFRPPQSAATVAAISPRFGTGGGQMSVAVASATLLDGLTLTPPPGLIGMTEIDQIWLAAKAFSDWDNLYGGLAREAPIALLRWSARLLASQACPSVLRAHLLSAVAYLAHTCGFMAFDVYVFDDARRLLHFGVACAEEADDWHMRARLLATTARLETWVGQPDRGLTDTQVALVRAERLTPTERAMLHSLEARALSRMHRTQEAMTAVGQADDAFEARDPDEDPAWMRYYDHAQHAGDVGIALLDLALGGSVDPDCARTRLITGIEDRPPSLVRSRALSQLGLAKLTMVTGDPAEAVSIGRSALELARPVRSRRVLDDLTHLSQLAERHRDRADVVDLRHWLDTATEPWP
jgi:hypothetical protein